MTTTTNTQTKLQIDFQTLMNQLLSLLSDKEQDVIRRRFSLNNSPKETLDRIGQSFSITRERVRQIESVALKKLSRVSLDPSMRKLHMLAYTILIDHGRVMSEDALVTEMLKGLDEKHPIDTNTLKLAIRVSDKLVKQEKNQFYRAFWRTNDLTLLMVKNCIKQIQVVLRNHKEVLTTQEIAEKCGHPITEQMVKSLLGIDFSFKHVKDDTWGLTTWRHINPRSIKDRIMISLRNNDAPLHFAEVANRVLEDFKGKKSVTRQAIHNELIRHEDFVLVGRGLYGLREWGMSSGTVCDVIKEVLLESEGPMKRQEIIDAVLQKREIRLGTISLNLQKYPFFRRVGRAVYEYAPELDTRRKKKNIKRG